MKTLVILEDFEIQENIVSSLSSAGVDSHDIIPCSYKDSGLFLKDLSIQLILLEVKIENPATAFSLMDNVKLFNPIAKIIPIIHHKDTDIILQLIKRGVDDVLIYPVGADELREIVKKFSGSLSPSQGGKAAFNGTKGKVISITSYKGGTGVSTIAANLGFCFAELDAIKKKTLIVDLANQSNHCSMLLNAQSTLTINEVCREINRIESAYIFSSVTWASPNLAVIGSDTGVEGIQPIEFEPLKKAIELFTQSFECVVIDVPTHTFDGRFLASIDHSDQIVVVSTIDITSIRDTRLYLNMLKSLGADNSKLRLLINRYDCDTGMFKTKDLEQAFQSPISFYLPNDFLTTNEAAQSGEAVLEFKSKSMLAEAIAELAIGLNTGSMFIPPKAEGKKKSQTPGLGIGNILSNLKK